MKRNRELENIFNECLERLLAGDRTVDECLCDYPEQADELAPLLETAVIASQVRDMRPRPEFRDRARYEFQAALREPVHGRRFFALHWPRWANAVAVALAVVITCGGTAAAAEYSMPDGNLYPVKLATEQVRLAFTFSDTGKATLYAELTDRRITEMEIMVTENKAEYLYETAERLDDNLEAVVALAGGSTEDQDNGVFLMMEPASEATRAPEAAPAAGSPDVKTQETEDAAVDEDPAGLDTIIANYARLHLDRLRDLLETAPESARPALEKALAIAEVRYQQALQAIEAGMDNQDD